MAYSRGMWMKGLTLAFAISLFVPVWAQESLQESLQEEGDYYNNFGVTGYSKKEIEQQKIPYFDNFGNHVVNGYLIYGLQTDRNKYFDSDGETKFSDPEDKTRLVDDTTVNAYSNMFQTSLVSENFNNLILAQDALGDMKSVFLVGSQIHTRFTPMTMNKLNFQGVRWDIWTPSLKFTTLISRTRPFVMSQNDVSARSYVSYDRTDMRNWQGVKSGDLLPDEEFIQKNWAATKDEFPGRRDGWILMYDYMNDYSNKSIYGDYDILWGFHGKTNVANVMDVGLSYLNHHRSDIKKGEKILSGDVPDDYVPEEIHLEIYDLTPEDVNDLGAKLDDIRMRINGEDLGTLSEGAFYSVGSDGFKLVPSSKLIEITGKNPLIAAFNISAAALKIGGLRNVRKIDFDFTVSGNYVVFVSTDKMVSYGYSAQRRTGSTDVDIDGPFTRRVEDLTKDFKPVETPTSASDNVTIGGPSVSTSKYWYNYGNSWFGDYIAKSPRALFSRGAQKNAYYQTTKRSYHYSYNINTASITYGLDFKGKVLGVKFSGEVALNQKNSKFPGGESLDPVYRLASYLRFDRDIVPNLLAVSGMVYNVDPEYDPALEIPMASQYFSYSRLYTRQTLNEEYSIPDYLYYPQHFNNNFRLLDDNDDNDLSVESDRLIYPADLGNGNAPNRWYADGTFSSYKASIRDDRKLNRKANYINMPNNLYMFYGDDDGVYVDRFDRNHNGQVDYTEDFLLYYTDPPIFSLDNDADNNGVWDVEDDDPYPDLPNGIKVSYVLTANGWKSQGIRGANAKLVYTPVKNLEVAGSVLYEKAIDLDFNRGSSDGLDEPSFLGAGKIKFSNPSVPPLDEEFQDSRSFGVKASARLDVVKRNIGLEYFAGAEGQYLRDNIRNDVVRLQEVQDIEYLYQDYYYQTDELRFRKAALGNLIAGATYNNIPNFIYNAKLSLGAVKRMAITDDAGVPDSFYTVRTLRSQVKDTTFYESRWEPYTASLFTRLFLVNKFDYTLKFKLDYKGWKSGLNVLNRLTINPQYKFTWSLSNSDAVDDPRDDLVVGQRLSESDSTTLRLDWARYRLENENILSSIPMLRMAFKIAERTQFQYGYEWKRDYDRLIKSESGSRTVHTFQVYSTDNVAGYSIVLLMGMNFIRNDYDILNYDRLFENGHSYDGKDTRFFIQVYAGN